ncbi:MAG: hypothetical protein WAM14_12945 [Candidatus Nitrosopolaris sp.]
MKSLISNIRRLINCHHNTKVYTDEYLAYENLKKYGFIHKQTITKRNVASSEGESEDLFQLKKTLQLKRRVLKRNRRRPRISNLALLCL